MTPFKRVAATISASFSSLMDQVENHEALVTQTIREVKHASAQATVRLNRVKQDEARLEQRLADLRREERLWADRAVQVGRTDETKGLECVRRLRRTKADLTAVEALLRKQTELRSQLTQDIRSIQSKLDELERKKHALATRQYRAEALRMMQTEGPGVLEEIDEIFERWETRVTETEIHGGCTESLDDQLDEEFKREEDEESLRAGLRELLGKREH